MKFGVHISYLILLPFMQACAKLRNFYLILLPFMQACAKLRNFFEMCKDTKYHIRM